MNKMTNADCIRSKITDSKLAEMLDAEHYKVIGNVFDNADLLEVK